MYTSCILPSLAQSIATVRQTGRPLLLEFRADWCGACRRMEDEVLPDARVRAALRQWSVVQYDIDASPGREAADLLRIRGIPVLMAIDETGAVQWRHDGALEVQPLIDSLSVARTLILPESQLTARLRGQPADATALLIAARRAVARLARAEAVALYERAEAADVEGRSGVAADALWERQRLQPLGETCVRTDKTCVKGLVTRKAALAAEFLRRFPASRHGVVALRNALLSGAYSPEECSALLTGFLPAAEALSNDSLNTVVYVALAARLYDEALGVAQQLTRRAAREAGYWDTLAEVYHHRGQRELALLMGRKALGLSRTDAERKSLAANLQRFERGPAEPSPIVQLQVRDALEDMVPHPR